jgi:bifunctional non-homologous end joining protein LigD
VAGDVTVEVDGRLVRLTTLDRVLWPQVGATKRDLIRYVTEFAPLLLAHVGDHPLTLRRFPDGVAGKSFFQTRAPVHPSWVRTVTLTTPAKGKVLDVVVLDDVASLVWAANISAIELHPYLGTADEFDRPTMVVFDLDPGPPADLVSCCDVALTVRTVLDAVGLRSWPKVSGAKGLHVHVPVDSADYSATRLFAHAIARMTATHMPANVTTTMNRRERRGRVFIDWMQNHPWKSTISPYSLRGMSYPSVAAPVTWDEVERVTASRSAREIVFLAGDMAARIDRHGDLMADAIGWRQPLPASLTATGRH